QHRRARRSGHRGRPGEGATRGGPHAPGRARSRVVTAAKAPQLAYVLARSAPRGAPEIAHKRADGLKRAARLWVGVSAHTVKRPQGCGALGAALRSRDAGARVLAALGESDRAILAIVARFGGAISGRLLSREAVARGLIADPKPGSPEYYTDH